MTVDHDLYTVATTHRTLFLQGDRIIESKTVLVYKPVTKSRHFELFPEVYKMWKSFTHCMECIGLPMKISFAGIDRPPYE